jgi:ABC-type enterobactin transport system permease subunit
MIIAVYIFHVIIKKILIVKIVLVPYFVQNTVIAHIMNIPNAKRNIEVVAVKTDVIQRVGVNVEETKWNVILCYVSVAPLTIIRFVLICKF